MLIRAGFRGVARGAAPHQWPPRGVARWGARAPWSRWGADFAVGRKGFQENYLTIENHNIGLLKH